jgi:hypothetical protein
MMMNTGCIRVSLRPRLLTGAPCFAVITKYHPSLPPLTRPPPLPLPLPPSSLRSLRRPIAAVIRLVGPGSPSTDEEIKRPLCLVRQAS